MCNRTLWQVFNMLATTKGGYTAVFGFHWCFRKLDCSEHCCLTNCSLAAVCSESSTKYECNTVLLYVRALHLTQIWADTTCRRDCYSCNALRMRRLFPFVWFVFVRQNFEEVKTQHKDQQVLNKWCEVNGFMDWWMYFFNSIIKLLFYSFWFISSLSLRWYKEYITYMPNC